MSFEVKQSLSRRTIVRTGTKLAYAAPLLAASVGTRSAVASVPVSGPTFTGRISSVGFTDEVCASAEPFFQTLFVDLADFAPGETITVVVFDSFNVEVARGGHETPDGTLDLPLAGTFVMGAQYRFTAVGTTSGAAADQLKTAPSIC
jgi:hypothetical protein